MDSSNKGHCSTSLCEFEKFGTLGVCSECEQRNFSGHIGSLFGRCSWRNTSANATDSTIVFGMNGNETDETTTKIMIQEIKKSVAQESWELSVQCGQANMAIYSYAKEPTDSMSLTQYMTFIFSLFDPSDSQRIVKGPYESDDGDVMYLRYYLGSGQDKTFEGGRLSACKHTPEINEYTDPIKILDSTCLSISTDLLSWFDETALSDQFGNLSGTETRCSLTPCVQQVIGSRLQSNQFSARGSSSSSKWYQAILAKSDGREYLLCYGDEGDCPYSWGHDSLTALGSWMNSTIATESFSKMYWTQANSPGKNFTLFHERIATQVSALLQSQLNPDLVNFTGVAYGTEVYVQVRWMWFILPIVMMVSSLLIVMFIVGDSGRKDYLFKNNILAAIAFELHGWEPHEYGVDETWTRDSMRNVEKKAERMVAKMQLPYEGDGALRLKRE